MSQRGRKLQVDWQEDAALLHRLYRQEPEGEHRTRLHALWLLRQGVRLQETAGVLGVRPRTVQNWAAWYRRGGLAELRRHPRGGGAPGAGAHAKLTAEQQAALREYTRGGTCRRVQEAQEWVRLQYGVEYSYWGMWKLLHRLRLRPKVPRPQAAKADPAQQAGWKGGAPNHACPARDHPLAGRDLADLGR